MKGYIRKWGWCISKNKIEGYKEDLLVSKSRLQEQKPRDSSTELKGSIWRSFNCMVIGSQSRIYLESQGLLRSEDQ